MISGPAASSMSSPPSPDHLAPPPCTTSAAFSIHLRPGHFIHTGIRSCRTTTAQTTGPGRFRRGPRTDHQGSGVFSFPPPLLSHRRGARGKNGMSPDGLESAIFREVAPMKVHANTKYEREPLEDYSVKKLWKVPVVMEIRADSAKDAYERIGSLCDAIDYGEMMEEGELPEMTVGRPVLVRERRKRRAPGLNARVL